VNRHPVRTLTLFLSLYALAPAAGAAAEARAWLNQMSQALQALDYTGTFVYQRQGSLEAMRIVHAADDGVEREKLSSLTGPLREVIRDNQVVTCILGDRRAVMVSKSRPRQPFPTSFARDIGDLEQYYRFEMGGRDRVAGLTCQVIEVQPRDVYRYGHRLCVEVGRRMLLRSQLTDERGRVIEQVMFTDIAFPEEIDEAELRPDLEQAGFTWSRESEHQQPAPQAGSHQHWKVERLPAGFMMTDHSWHQLDNHAPGVEHWMYSDGLASVSVYIEKARDAGEDYRGMSRRGALNAFGTMVNGHYVTVVGEVPRATVEMIGRSVRYQP